MRMGVGLKNIGMLLGPALLGWGLAAGAEDGPVIRNPEPAVPPKLEAQISWVGNDWPGNPAWVPMNVADLHVTPEGDLYTNVDWEEGGGNTTRFDADGQWLGVAGHTHGWGYEGGQAVTANSQYLFLGARVEYCTDPRPAAESWPREGFEWLGVSRRQRADFTQGAPFEGGKGGKGDTLPESFRLLAEYPLAERGHEMIRGLTANDQWLFVGLRGRGAILMLDAETMAEVAAAPLPRVDRLALAPDGRLWALQAPENPEDVWRLLHFDPPENWAQSPPTAPGNIPSEYRLPPDWRPASMAFGPDGRLYLADTGVGQQIRILAGLTGPDPKVRPDGAIGAPGGLLADGPRKGETGPLRFHHPVGAGLDRDGNLYVANTGANGGGGLLLESYTPDGTLRWQRRGLFFIDVVDLDPETMTIHTKEEVFAFDPDREPGDPWHYQGVTYDPDRFPDDPRNHPGHGFLNAWFRKLDGQPFLFTAGNESSVVGVFRADPKLGMILKPCGLIARRPLGEALFGGWPREQPNENDWRWTDANGDGHMQAGEFAVAPEGPGYPGMTLYLDREGGWWFGYPDELRRYSFSGINAAGAPEWNWDEPVVFPRPAELETMRRVTYDPDNDRLYLAGTRGEDRNQHWKPMGPVLTAYEGVRRGRPVHLWTRRLPFERGSSGHESREAMGMDVAGDLIYIGYTRGLAVEETRTAYIKVLRAGTGETVGTLDSWDVTGEIGLLDTPYPVTARALPDGRHVVFLEDDYKAKNVMFIWRPE